MDVRMDVDLHAKENVAISEDVNMTALIHDEQLVTISTELRRSCASYMTPESARNHSVRVQQVVAELDRQLLSETEIVFLPTLSSSLGRPQVFHPDDGRSREMD